VKVHVACVFDIQIRVIDTGLGIKENDLKNLFTPFEVLRDSLSFNKEGCGLGLTISKKLALALGGDLTAESTINKGSIFTISLPFSHRAKRTTGEVKSMGLLPNMDLSFTEAESNILVPDYQPLVRIQKYDGELRTKSRLATSNNGTSSCMCSKVLVADDEPFNIFVMEKLLNRQGVFKLDNASDGLEALDKIK